MEIFKKYKKIIIAAGVLVICTALVLCIVPVRLTASDYDYKSSKPTTVGELKLEADVLAPEGMQRVAESEQLSLFINPETADFSVYDKQNKNYWRSNPTAEQAAQSQGLGTVKSEMKSQILLTYYNDKDLLQYFNSFEHCVQQGNISIGSIENGVAVTYKIGETDIDITMLPAAVPKDKFESLVLSKLSDGEQKKAVDKYYELKKPSEGSEREKKKYAENFSKLSMNKQYYFLDLYAPDYALPKLYDAIFKQTDYSENDLYSDNEAVGYKTQVKTLLQVEITVEYTIENGEFYVRIPAEGVSVPDSISVTELSVLPFFAAAGVSDSGYMIVPDGSGALINLNNGRINTQTLTVPIYGRDTTLSKTENNISENTGLMPIYGMVKNGGAYLAVIESGDTCAELRSRVSGMSTDYNQIYPCFNILVMDPMVIRTNKGKMSTNVYAEKYFDSDISLRFTFYGEGQANYSALARNYRDYLIEKGTLKQKKDELDRLNIGFTGKITVEKSIAGIGYETQETVTSFKQAREIVRELKKLGVEDIGITYSSWYGGGLAAALPDNASPAAGMGGKKALSALEAEVGEDNLSLGASTLKIWQGYPVINPLKYANRLITNKTDKDYRYNVSTNLPEKDGASYYILDARYVGALSNKYVSSVKKLNINAVALEDMGSILSSNFEKGNQLNRTAAKALVSQALNKIAEDANLTLTAPNIYAAGYADRILELPTASSGNNLTDCSVPFMQIVLSGCVDYTVPSINGLGTPVDNILKAVETGSELYFDWIYSSDEDVAEFEGVESTLMFSQNYENWVEFAAEQYLNIKEKLSGVATGAITQHRELAIGVYRTDWENGGVIVNYTNKDITVDGISIAAKDFVVTEKR